MSDVSPGLGWWQASDGKWYAPELHPDYHASTPADQSAAGTPELDSDQVFAPADSTPVFPPADSTPVFAPADSTPVFAPADSTPVFAPADSTPVFAPADGAATAFPAVGTDQVFAVANQSDAAAYSSTQYPDVPAAAGKSKMVAGLLAIFLGAVGAHRFYLGYWLIGAIMLIITAASLGRLAPITALWGIIEGILIFTGKMKKDKYGRKMR